MRNRDFLLVDILLLAGLPLAVLLLHTESWSIPPGYARTAVAYSLLALPLRLAVAYFVGLYRCLWQHASIAELERLIFAGSIAGVVTCVAGTAGLRILGLPSMPLGAMLLDAFGALCVLAGSRTDFQHVRGAGKRLAQHGEYRLAITFAGFRIGLFVVTRIHRSLPVP